MKKVAVIMSTYNGEKFLQEQLESLCNQDNVELTLFVRDDGSKDNTLDIIRSFCEKINIVVKKGENVGFENSFMKATLLTKDYINEFDYFAFCDQDDVWDFNKLDKAVQYIYSSDTKCGLLYCSNQRIINEEGNVIRNEPNKKDNIVKESSLLSLNQRGCVMVWNRFLHRHLLDSYEMLSKQINKTVPAHDTWITILAYAVGKVFLDSSITMSYRVSTHNVAGSYLSEVGRISYIYKKIIRVIKKNKFQKQKQASLLYDYLKLQPKVDIEYINYFLYSQKNILSRIRFIVNRKYFLGMSKKWKLLSSLLILYGII